MAVARTGDTRPEGTDPGPAGRRGLDPQSDAWLIDRARRGSLDAGEVLIRRHRDRIYRIAVRMLGDFDDAEDVTQDVAIQIWTALSGLTGTSTFTTWLYRVVINRCINHQRRRRPPTRVLRETDHPPTPGPEDTVVARQQVDATSRALARLPTDLRSALVLHEMEGLTYHEVAAVLKLSESTVRGRIFRARRHLLDDLREWS